MYKNFTDSVLLYDRIKNKRNICMNMCTQRFLVYYYQHYLFAKICLLILLCFTSISIC